jgi:hypothetical protein
MLDWGCLQRTRDTTSVFKICFATSPAKIIGTCFDLHEGFVMMWCINERRSMCYICPTLGYPTFIAHMCHCTSIGGMSHFNLILIRNFRLHLNDLTIPCFVTGVQIMITNQMHVRCYIGSNPLHDLYSGRKGSESSVDHLVC